MAAGSLAAGTTAAIFNPLELVKTRMHVRRPEEPARGMVASLQRVRAQEGWGALWRHGFAPFVLRDLAYSGIRIGMYPTVRDRIAGAERAQADGIGLGPKVRAGAGRRRGSGSAPRGSWRPGW